MSRKRGKASTGPAVSLFPFLAVLICTMGVLIVMLVLAVKSSSVQASKAKQEHQQDVMQERDKLLQKLDHETFRVEQIAKVRPKVQQRLEDTKLIRSHLDNEILQLEEKAKQLRTRLEQLDSDRQLAESSSDADQELVEKLTQDIAAKKAAVAELREQVAGKPTLYSIVPTRTANGTNRRPIYVECKPEGIELQPSGIKIAIADFTRPILPGNPLDAALLATREYWNKFEAGSSEGEPYPLIVVRPGGASAYAIARRAMSSWDDEFGYELVEAEKQLDWGTPDKNLTDSIGQAMSLAMARQQKMVNQRVAQWMGPRANRRLAVGSAATNNGSGSQVTTQGGFASGRAAPRSANPNPTSPNGLFRGGSKSSFDTSRQDSLSRIAENKPQWRPGQQNGDDPNPLRDYLGNSTNQSPGEFESPAGGTQSNTAQANGKQAANKQPANSQNNSSAMQAGPDPSALANVAPLSDHRGADWALPTRTPGATPYRRPIRVECFGDRYIVYPGDEALSPIQVAVNSANVDQAIDQLIHQVWKQIEGWGMAEIGGYWKPVLRLAPDESGTRRAEELARKLEGSGIEIERIWR